MEEPEYGILEALDRAHYQSYHREDRNFLRLAGQIAEYILVVKIAFYIHSQNSPYSVDSGINLGLPKNDRKMGRFTCF